MCSSYEDSSRIPSASSAIEKPRLAAGPLSAPRKLKLLVLVLLAALLATLAAALLSALTGLLLLLAGLVVLATLLATLLAALVLLSALILVSHLGCVQAEVIGRNPLKGRSPL